MIVKWRLAVPVLAVVLAGCSDTPPSEPAAGDTFYGGGNEAAQSSPANNTDGDNSAASTKDIPPATTEHIPAKPKATESTKPASSAKDAQSSARGYKTTLQSIDLAGFQQFVEKQKGKTVVVDNWATW